MTAGEINMDRVDEVMNIINQDITDEKKKTLINDILLDLKNEMEAQDQNMNPEVRKRVSEAYQLACKYLLKNVDILP
jgi:hypothetical protein